MLLCYSNTLQYTILRSLLLLLVKGYGHDVRVRIFLRIRTINLDCDGVVFKLRRVQCACTCGHATKFTDSRKCAETSSPWRNGQLFTHTCTHTHMHTNTHKHTHTTCTHTHTYTATNKTKSGEPTSPRAKPQQQAKKKQPQKRKKKGGKW